MGWYDSNWQFRAKIEINGTLVDDNLDDFPIYLDLGQFTSNHSFWSTVQDDGDDIRVTEGDGVSEVPIEVVSVDKTNKTGEMHFLAQGSNGLSSTQNTVFYIYYGNDGATGKSEGGTYGRHALWDPNYYGVYHDYDKNASPEIENSASGPPDSLFDEASPDASFDGGIFGDYSGETSDTKIGQTSLRAETPDDGFDATDRAQVTDSDEFHFVDSNDNDLAFSVSCWGKPTEDTSNDRFLVSKADKEFPEEDEFSLEIQSGTDLVFRIEDTRNGSQNGTIKASISNVLTIDEWGYFAGSYDGSGSKDGVDAVHNGSTGSLNQSASGTYTRMAKDDDLLILFGNDASSTSGEPNKIVQWRGLMDEIRIANNRLSRSWFKTEYNNQNEPNNFYTLGAGQTESELNTGAGACGRGLSQVVKDEIEKTEISPAVFFEFSFGNGKERYWTGYGDRWFGNKKFIGAGDLISISAIQEQTEIKASSLTFTLEGISSDQIDNTLNLDHQNKQCKVWLGFLDNKGRLIDTPDIEYIGRQDVMTIKEAGGSASIEMKSENRLILLNKANDRRYTNEDQKIDYPDDDFFEYVTDLQDKRISFGPKS